MIYAHKLIDAIKDRDVAIPFALRSHAHPNENKFVVTNLNRDEIERGDVFQDTPIMHTPETQRCAEKVFDDAYDFLDNILRPTIEQSQHFDAGDIADYPDRVDDVWDESYSPRLPFRRMYFEMDSATITMHVTCAHAGDFEAWSMQGEGITTETIVCVPVFYSRNHNRFWFARSAIAIFADSWTHDTLRSDDDFGDEAASSKEEKKTRETVYIATEAFLHVLNKPRTLFESHAPPEKIQRKRIRTGKTPRFEHKTLVLNYKPPSGDRTGKQTDGERRSPRLHLRRGHWRRFRDDTGNVVARTWIDPMWVGDIEHGVVSKDYKIKQ